MHSTLRDVRSVLTVLLLLAATQALTVRARPAPDQERGAPGTPTTVDGLLACARAAVGGRAALDGVASFAVIIRTQPRGDVKGIQATIREVTGRFPDSYKSVSRSPATPTGLAPITRISGFAGRQSFFGTATTDAGVTASQADESSIAILHHDFARYAFVWFMRQTAGIPLTLAMGRPRTAGEQGHVILEASGPSDFNARVLFFTSSCVPASMTFDRPENMADMLRDRARQAAGGGTAKSSPTRTEYFRFSAFKPFDGVLLPTAIETGVDSSPLSDWTITPVQLNPTLPARFFSLSTETVFALR